MFQLQTVLLQLLNPAHHIITGDSGYLDPLDGSDALLDEDGDGYSNLREYRVGTDPDDTDSHPRGAHGLELLLNK